MKSKIKTVGGAPIVRKVNLLKTDLASTFKRIRREQAAAVRKEQGEKVRPIKRKAG